jgi:hypothetical protein
MQTKNKRIAVFVFLFAIIGLLFFYEIEFKDRDQVKGWHKPNIEFIKQTEKKVIVTASPNFIYSYDSMKNGVIQHLDRDYTYDYTPEDLKNGVLFQGIHRPSKGTTLKIELFQPATIHFFFHYALDGGYSKIFSTLEEWEKSNDAPQYDIHNGDHGLRMKMYKMNAKKGTYIIPATTKDRACFNLVFNFD